MCSPISAKLKDRDTGTTSHRGVFQHLLAIFTEAIFPGICCGCGAVFKIGEQFHQNSQSLCLTSFFEAQMASFLCPKCRQHFQPITSPLCEQCGKPFESANAINHLCSQCVAQPPPYKWARAAALHADGLRLAIHHYKYKRADRLAQPFGRLLWRTLCNYEHPSRFDYVVPVPLHPRRLRWRGFNQAQMLTRQWPTLAARQNMALGPQWIAPGVLKRDRYTTPQTGLNKSQRKANLRNAFHVVKDKDITGARILLVDDVLTTGATADACTRTLINAGAAQVCVITLARAVL